ncbi:hypothetical protein [Paenibacillus woosongensis]|uniref:Uncharacterized protein n=1 Tax=Paenibacillus woosongensis TaxID=307580 RepID=A0A7X2YX70_9BACL|nr:hypothetical protein [Paenibacillus woosongensis]MUG43442.1 hypothetical protein [Paenibacillus woosongensis]
MSKLRELTSGYTFDNKPIAFADFLETLAGSGEIYERVYGEILEASLDTPTTFEDVFEIIVPITTEILTFTQEEQPEIYRELLKDIKKAHDRLLKCREYKEIIIDKSVDSPKEADDKLTKVIQFTENRWVLEELDNRLGSEGYLKAILLRTVKYKGEDHEDQSGE